MWIRKLLAEQKLLLEWILGERPRKQEEAGGKAVDAVEATWGIADFGQEHECRRIVLLFIGLYTVTWRRVSVEVGSLMQTKYKNKFK